MKKNTLPSLVFWLLFFGLISGGIWYGYIILRGPVASPETVCKSNMRSVHLAMWEYKTANKLEFGAPVGLDDLLHADLISDVPTCPEHGGYIITGRVPEPHQLFIRCSGEEHMK